MALNGLKKIVSTIMVLAIMLAPVEYTFAHTHMEKASCCQTQMHHVHSDSQMSDSQLAHNIVDHNHHSVMDQGNCCDQSGCNDCFHCSPAISTSAFDLTSFRYTPTYDVAFPTYHVDLVLEKRPPRQF